MNTEEKWKHLVDTCRTSPVLFADELLSLGRLDEFQKEHRKDFWHVAVALVAAVDENEMFPPRLLDTLLVSICLRLDIPTTIL